MGIAKKIKIIKSEGEVKTDGSIIITDGGPMADLAAFYQNINKYSCHPIPATKIIWSEGASGKDSLTLYGDQIKANNFECASIRSAAKILREMHTGNNKLEDLASKFDGNCGAYTFNIAIDKIYEVMGDCNSHEL